MLKSAPKAKFNESVDISINLGIDATKSDQGVRGSSTLPHGIGKTMTVVAFADGEDEKAAKDAGADEVGFEDLIDKVKKDKDLNAGTIIDGTQSIKEVGMRIFEKIIAVASGEKTKSELNGVGDEEFQPWFPGAQY